MPKNSSTKKRRSSSGDSDSGGFSSHIEIKGGQVGQLAGRDIINKQGVSFNMSTGDQQIVQKLFSDVRSQLDEQPLSKSDHTQAEQHLNTLEQQFTASKPPDAEAIKRSGSGLLDKVPGIAGALVTLFSNPIVGKIVELAGDVAVDWVKNRLGIDTKKE